MTVTSTIYSALSFQIQVQRVKVSLYGHVPRVPHQSPDQSGAALSVGGKGTGRAGQKAMYAEWQAAKSAQSLSFGKRQLNRTNYKADCELTPAELRKRQKNQRYHAKLKQQALALEGES